MTYREIIMRGGTAWSIPKRRAVHCLNCRSRWASLDCLTGVVACGAPR